MSIEKQSGNGKEKPKQYGEKKSIGHIHNPIWKVQVHLFQDPIPISFWKNKSLSTAADFPLEA